MRPLMDCNKNRIICIASSVVTKLFRVSLCNWPEPNYYQTANCHLQGPERNMIHSKSQLSFADNCTILLARAALRSISVPHRMATLFLKH